ncbi:TIGR00725 family protein [Ferroplasma sp.]|uniref:TIGR00725 family protein n=1 Tax=Ferroplasma sp. TaxID=2591003 RepID=UPI00307E4BE6
MYQYHIGVIGGSFADEKYCQIAYKIGEKLAENNCAVFCGGNGGIMECVAHGVYDNKGMVIGILPGEDRMAGNKYLSLAIPTGIGYLRNFFIVRASDAIIAIEGYSGTTSEAAFALTEGKTVISVGELNINTKHGDGKLIKENDPEKVISIALDEAKKFIKKI